MLVLLIVFILLSLFVLITEYWEFERKSVILIDLDGTVFPWEMNADYMKEGFFENLEAAPSMKELVDILRECRTYKFRFCSAYMSERAKEEKWKCLKRIWPDLNRREVIFVPYGKSKFDYVPEVKNGDTKVCIVDDYSHNLFDAEAHGVKGIKAMNGYNGTNGTWRGLAISIYEPATRNLSVIETVLK